MNSGYILGVVRQSGRPLANTVVGLDWIRGGGQEIQFYSPDADAPSDRLEAVGRGVRAWDANRIGTAMPAALWTMATETNALGQFTLAFQWSGTDLGLAMDNPTCQIRVLGEDQTPRGPITRVRGRYQAPMVRAVAMTQVSSGLIAKPTQLADQIGLGTDFLTIIRGIRRPMIGLTVAAPSPDMYTLVAGFRINL